MKRMTLMIMWKVFKFPKRKTLERAMWSAYIEDKNQRRTRVREYQ
jgi:hypothetical protein